MNKKIWKILLILLVIIIAIFTILYIVDLNRMKNGQEVFFSTLGKDYSVGVKNEENIVDSPKIETDMNVALSLEDEISDNYVWCGTFNLIWNDLKNEIAKQDIVFTPQLDIVRNLNKGTFNTSYLSEESYYKTYGHPSWELKQDIEKEIKEKFNETSDILDDFNWQNSSENDYFLYTMLKKNFEFPQEFSELDNGKFGNFENVKYFGINEQTSEEVRDQVQVLYYESEDDFAIKLLTKGNDEVIISRGNSKSSFLEAYEEIKNRATKYVNYVGLTNLSEKDTLKIPNINIDLKQEFADLEQKPFLFSNGDTYVIEKALQTIKFELDKKGGKIKSEAGIMTRETAILVGNDPRNFIVDDTFDIYLIEKEKELPYFASRISDISKVQKDAIKISK